MTPKWDRLAPNPPDCLKVLRNKGHWRHWRLPKNPTADDCGQALGRCRYFVTGPRNVFLDAGCGNSPDAHLAIKVFGFRWATKIDLWPPYIGEPNRWSDALIKLEAGRVKYIQGDICNMAGVMDNSVDMIGCNAMIDLLCACERDMFYTEACRVLRPGGVLSISRVHLAAGHNDWRGSREVYHMRECGLEIHGYGRYNQITMCKPIPGEPPICLPWRDS